MNTEVETTEDLRDPRRDPERGDVVEREQIPLKTTVRREVLRVYQDGDGVVHVTYKQPFGLPKTCRRDAWRRWARNGTVVHRG